MIRPRATRSVRHGTAHAVRLSALATATTLLVLGTAPTASAQCSEPNYRGSRTFPGGSCPEQAAGVTSGVVWAVLALAAGLWLAYALSRSRSTTNADLAVVDAVFTTQDPGGDTPVEGPVEQPQPTAPPTGEQLSADELGPPSS